MTVTLLAVPATTAGSVTEEETGLSAATRTIAPTASSASAAWPVASRDAFEAVVSFATLAKNEPVIASTIAVISIVTSSSVMESPASRGSSVGRRRRFTVTPLGRG